MDPSELCLRYQRIVESSSEGIVTVDASDRIDFANQRAAELLGYTVAEMVGRSSRQFLLSAGEVDTPCQMHKLEQRPLQHDMRMRRKDGSMIWADLSIAPLHEVQGCAGGAVIMFSDSTARRQAEAALRQSEEQYRRFFFAEDLTGDFLAGLDGRLQLCNPAFARLFGYESVEEIMAVPAFSLFPEPAERDRVVGRLSSEKKVSPRQRVFTRRDGREIVVIESLIGIFDTSGALTQVQGYLLDLTERIQAEERALRAERLAVIGQLATGLAHESRNALQGIQACLERLTWKLQDRPDALDLVNRIQEEQDRLHRLHDDIRCYAAPLKLAHARCNLSETWHRIWAKATGPLQVRHLVLREENLSDDPSCEADEFRVEQVLRNVLDNALDACGMEVQIEFACMDAHLDGRPAICIAVRDNGPGLTPEQRERIFEPFYTTKPRGTGLGMALARRIVEAHGGRIELGANGHQGTEILITLPRRKT